MLLQNRGGLLPLDADKVRRVAVIGPHAAEVMLGGYSGVPRHSVSILEGDPQAAGGRRHRPSMPRGCASPRTRPSPAVLSRSSAGPVRRRGGRPTAWLLADPAANRSRIAEAVALARDQRRGHRGRRRQRADHARGVRRESPGRPRRSAAGGTAGGPGPRGARYRQADGAGADQRPSARDPGAGRARPRPFSRAGTWARRAAPPWPRSSSATSIPAASFPSASRAAWANCRSSTTTSRRRCAATCSSPPGRSSRSATASRTRRSLIPTPTVSPVRIAPDGRTTASVEVTNTGSRAGDEVVQLYIRAEVSRVTRPVMELKGFRRITPGARRAAHGDLRDGAGAAFVSRAGDETRRRAGPVPGDGRGEFGQGEIGGIGGGGEIGCLLRWFACQWPLGFRTVSPLRCHERWHCRESFHGRSFVHGKIDLNKWLSRRNPCFVGDFTASKSEHLFKIQGVWQPHNAPAIFRSQNSMLQ